MMRPIFAAAVTVAVFSVSFPVRDAEAQSFPALKGTVEYGAGVAAISLSEEQNGSISAQPEVRAGYFLSDGLMLQVALDMRVWPLGTQAPSTYGVAGHALYFPDLGAGRRSVYLMAGAGGILVDPPNVALDSSIDLLLRGGVGIKIPLEEAGLAFLEPLHFTTEFRTEFLIADETDLLSGVSFGLSFVR